MKGSEYGYVEKKDVSGFKVFIKFPKNPEIDEDKFRQEIKKILSRALRESLGRAGK